MDLTYRFRFLIYFAAFMLVMSVCFVYAQPIPSQDHLLFQVAPQHAGFLAPCSLEPTFDPAALRAGEPTVSPLMLLQLQDATRGHHGLFHRSHHAALRVPASSAPASDELSAGAMLHTR